MFVLVEMTDTVRIPPWQFERKLNDSIAEELNKKLANKVKRGSCIGWSGRFNIPERFFLLFVPTEVHGWGVWGVYMWRPSPAPVNKETAAYHLKGDIFLMADVVMGRHWDTRWGREAWKRSKSSCWFVLKGAIQNAAWKTNANESIQ